MSEQRDENTTEESKETLWHKVARWVKRLFAPVVRWVKRLTVTEGTAGDLPKYHPGRAILLLILIGFCSLLLGIAIGVMPAIGCGVVFDLLKIPNRYYSDFLGGAVGLTVGFALDKLCIERINQISKYKKLIKIIKEELEHIEANKFYMGTNQAECLSISGYEEKVDDVLIKICVRAVQVEPLKLSESKLQNDSIEEEAWSSLKQYKGMHHTVEFIFDDIVRNAETMSVLANLPLAYEYSKELINEFEYIQNYLDRLEYYLDRYDYYSDRIDRKEGDEDENRKLKDENLRKAQIRWILMQYHLTRCLEVL